MSRKPIPKVKPVLGVARLNAQAMPKPRTAIPIPSRPVNDTEVIPTNEALLARSRMYSAELPVLLQSRITQVREHFLTDVLSLIVGVQNGLADAADVVKLSLKEQPDIGAYATLLTTLTRQAIFAKSVSFILRYSELDEFGARVFVHSILDKSENSAKSFSPADLAKLLEALPLAKEQPHPQSRRPRRKVV